MFFYSFDCIEKGVPIHVPKITSHSRAHYWNPELEVDVSLPTIITFCNSI